MRLVRLIRNKKKKEKGNEEMAEYESVEIACERDGTLLWEDAILELG